MAIQHWRILWRQVPCFSRYSAFWDAIRHDSVVVITAAEARTSALVPDRFVGAAMQMLVGSIAPFDGGVAFSVDWENNSVFPRLDIWTDITLVGTIGPADTTNA
jgi:hypothetical protein